MKASFLAVAILATIAISSAVDEECLHRKLVGLRLHWPNPTDCRSFYRCTNKNFKRQILCPTNKEYNPKTGRCGPMGKNLCKLSLRLAVDGSSNPCRNALSGSYLGEAEYCRNFYICNNNLAYPQTCESGSKFNATQAVCVPDTTRQCWENYCLDKATGVFMPNANDCHTYYVCSNKLTVPQNCPPGSYFDKNTLNCHPGDCPTNETTSTTQVSSTTTEPSTTPTTTTCISTTTTCSTTTCESTTSETTTCESTASETTTSKSTTCESTTSETTTCESTTSQTTTCESTTSKTTASETTTSETTTCETTTCETTTSETTTSETTTCEPTTTVSTTSTPCDEHTTSSTTPKDIEEECDQWNCDQLKCLQANDFTLIPAKDNNKLYCMCFGFKAVCRQCPQDHVFIPSQGGCAHNHVTTVSPAPETSSTTPCDTIPSTTSCVDDTTTATTTDITCAKSHCEHANCVNEPDLTILPSSSGDNKFFCLCVDDVALCRECPDGSEFSPNIGACFPTMSTTPIATETTTCVTVETTVPSLANKCKDNIGEGEFVPNPNNCMLFFICFDGKLIQSSCGVGNYFNKATKNCKADVDGICPDCQDSSSKNSRKKRSISQLPSDIDANCCPDGLENGDVIPHPTDCDKKLVCCDGDLKPEACDKGFYFNGALKECVKDVNNVCWPKTECVEGQVEQHPANCSMYLACCHGLFKEETCEQGYYFNLAVKKCIKDVNHICKPVACTCDGGVDEGELVPNPANCSSYYICSDGQLKPQYCGYGYYYSSAQRNCVKDNQNICWPIITPMCPGNIQEGENTPNPKNCSSYFRCCNGDLIEEFCGNGMLFDSKSKQCIPDVKNVCWPKEPVCDGGIKEGENTANPKNCSSYFKCCSGDLIEEFCGIDMLFDSKSKQCIPDVKNVCWPKEPVCDGGIKEGENTVNPKNCSSYFKCCSGDLIEEFCGIDMLFDSKSKQCIPDVKNVCWPKEPVCDGGIKEGENTANPKNCSSYFKCCNGDLIEEFCGIDMLFDSKSKECIPDVKNVCWPKEPVCDGGIKEGENTANPKNCSSYFRCCNGDLVEEFCGNGMFFDSKSGQCLADTEHLCWPKEPCTCSGGYKEGDKSPAKDCDKYYTCTGGIQVLGECGENMYYNCASATCVPDTEHKCWPNFCEGKRNGTMVANPKQCNGYYICENGKQSEGLCETGEWFDTKQSSCQPDMDAVCYNPCACQDQIKVLPHPDCRKFYFCNGNQTIVKTCPEGGFDPTIGDCNPNKKCSENECEDKPDYYTYAYDKDKTKFYICLKGVPVLKSCLPNTEYNGQVCAHVPSPDCDQKPCASLEYLTAYPTLNRTEDNAFCVCRKGYATKQYCAASYVFNAEMAACFSDAPCDPLMCTLSPDYTVFINRNNTKSFCLCTDKKAVIVPCPNNGTFNQATLSCTDNELSVRCDQRVCIGRGDYYTYPDYTESSEGFCMCMGNVGAFEKCPENSSFNVTMGVCQIKNIQCDSSKCIDLPDNTKIAALISTEGYCQCVNNNATYYNCQNKGEFNPMTQECMAPLCDSEKCLKAEDYTRFVAVGSTHGFCMCLKQEVFYKSCEEGGIFNTAMLVCQMPLINCPDTSCKGVTDKTKLPADYSIYGYCVCSGGKSTYQDCPTGQIYVATNRTCEKENVPVEDVCDITYCNDASHANKKYPSVKNIYGYCECTAAGPTFKHCPTGEIFDISLLTCRSTVSSQCDLAFCADATPNKGYPIPTKTGNTSFCYCTGPGNAMLINCPTDLFYNDKEKKCVGSIQNGCSCPGGLQNGDVAPDANDCSQYFLCDSGSMHQQSCPPGQYFNPECKKCQDDTTGICVNKDPCTCLGTYREGDRIEHPDNEQMYYVCKNQMLHERDCGDGRLFNKAIQQCMEAPHISFRHYPQKRSIDFDEFHCLDDDKRSVPSNCSKYELCRNITWQLHSCPPFNYYNPEQKQCLEPRDDTVCAYAKVANISICNEGSEGQLKKGRTCKTYYLCHELKWYLVSCGRKEYFDDRIKSCLAHHSGEKMFECNSIENGTETEPPHTESCRDLSMIPYSVNCAMYLICLGNQWWYNYCPSSMYFNTTLNYCLPDEKKLCPDSIKSATEDTNAAHSEIPKESCQQEGILRPSNWSCSVYYICIDGIWKEQNCAPLDYFDAGKSQCSPDPKGLCQKSKLICMPQEKRFVGANCTAYDECSSECKWIRYKCPQGKMYEDILKQCIDSVGICSSEGLRRVCYPQQFHRVSTNCTQFFYCLENQWTLGSCIKGNMYSHEKQTCVPHSSADKCKPFEGNQLEIESNDMNLCSKQLDGTFIAHARDCFRYYVCINQTASQEMQCPNGSYFDNKLGYCRPNDGSCRSTLEGECKNLADNSRLPHPADCQAYYICSSIQGQQLIHCPAGQYFHNQTLQCHPDKGECKGHTMPEEKTHLNSKCLNQTKGVRLPHDIYCNIYYICVEGMALAMECPENYEFNPVLQKCTYDQNHTRQHIKLSDENQNPNCGNFSDDFYVADVRNCTHYYICSKGQAHMRQCPLNTYFNAKQLLCVPDDGQCAVIRAEEVNRNFSPFDPNVCKDQHGKLMPDPINCNNFYVCINGKLRHERCYPQFFFNVTLNQCQNMTLNATTGVDKTVQVLHNNAECKLNTTSAQSMCIEYGVGGSLAEPGDCRFYITCEENGIASIQRCRNGESYDSLLGICRQNDGTCQMDSGQRAGECSKRHGQLTKASNNCRKYFACLNGQKIAQFCKTDEYFNVRENMCLSDISNTCREESLNLESSAQAKSCKGFSEAVFYPYIPDNCRSYFQCVRGVAKIQNCNDNLYFDPITNQCTQNNTTCRMPPQTEQRSPILGSTTYKKALLKTGNGQAIRQLGK